MARLTKRLAELDLYTTGSDPIGAEEVGSKLAGLNGKEFALAYVGGSALVAGNLLQSAAQDTQFQAMVVGTAAVVGQQFLQITNGTTTVVPYYWKGGSISIYTAGTDAIGDEYTIMDINGTLTTGGALNVFLDRPLRYAVSTSATVVMQKNPYNQVIQMPATTPTGVPVGIAIFAATAGSSTVFATTWVQTRGVASCLSDGSTFAVGSAVGTPSGTAGCVTVYAAATTKTAIGDALESAASAHAIAVNLRF